MAIQAGMVRPGNFALMVTMIVLRGTTAAPTAGDSTMLAP
jgi:hypothetical protein